VAGSADDAGPHTPRSFARHANDLRVSALAMVTPARFRPLACR